MTEQTAPQPGTPEIIPKSRGFSAVWAVPLVAAILGAWLVIKHFREAGVPIKLTFETASGIEAGKTKVKYRDIEIGVVEAVEVSADLKQVVLDITIRKKAKTHLRADNQFWVVEPRVGPGGISGLGTIISGAYINMRIGQGAEARSFKGLERPPIAPENVKGVRLVLKADNLGSLGPGEPIFFRDVQVGSVEETKLLDDGSGCEVRVLVEAPYDKFVHTTSRFWRASGIEVSFDSSGFQLRTASLATILSGGLAFDSPVGEGEPAKDGDEFDLYPGFREAVKRPHPDRGPFFVLYPQGPTRGLNLGAIVSLEGVTIGEVTDIKMEYSPESGIRTPVQVRLEPSKIQGVQAEDAQAVMSMITNLIGRGLRAQLKPVNLLTGELYVNLSFHPDTPQQLVGGSQLPELPTVPSTLVTLEQKASQFLDHLAEMPIDGLVTDARSSMVKLSELLEKVQPLVEELDGVASEARATLANAGQAIGSIEAGFAPGSTMYYDLATALEELSAAASSVRVLTGYLERHPNALIMGKSKSKGQ